jgi:hypothetical protein
LPYRELPSLIAPLIVMAATPLGALISKKQKA